MESIAVYTDGACSGNPGPGGWGAVLIFSDHKKEISGFEPNTTNNRMELTAVIQALNALNNNNLSVAIYTDSKYIVDAINKGWLDSWTQKNWLNSASKPVANKDLWEKLIILNQKFHPTYNWVKGHSSNELNNRCDELAVQAIKNSI